MTRYALCLKTVNRGRVNYLADTLASLARGGVFASAIPHEVHVIDGGSADMAHLDALKDYADTVLHLSQGGQTSNQTSIRGLEVALATGVPWIVMLEDDLHVCARFLESVDRWLGEHAHPGYHLYTFYAPYKEVRRAADSGQSTWPYAIASFYGTQCWAVRREEAQRLVAWYPTSRWAELKQGFDLFLKDANQGLWPDVQHFLASAPCFVQHIGRASALGHTERYHFCSSFRGEAWSYV
jgi:hypothetical protein